MADIIFLAESCVGAHSIRWFLVAAVQVSIKLEPAQFLPRGATLATMGSPMVSVSHTNGQKMIWYMPGYEI